ncbi:MAG: Crp/Fnr family transcriptional regulator [Solirubrobacteraceae bacterium]
MSVLPFRRPSDRLIREAAWVARCVGRAETAPLAAADLAVLAAYMTPRQVGPGTILFSEGDAPAGVWIVRSGRIELAVGPARRRAVVQMLRPGDVEGDIALILGKSPPYTARAVEDTLCLSIDASTFERLLGERAAVTRRWLSSAALRLDRSQARILELVGRSLPTQLARLLLDEATAGRVELPQDTLAAMLGVHRPSLNKVLKELEHEGHVQVGYGEVIIRDPDALNVIAERER